MTTLSMVTPKSMCTPSVSVFASMTHSSSKQNSVRRSASSCLVNVSDTSVSSVAASSKAESAEVADVLKSRLAIDNGTRQPRAVKSGAPSVTPPEVGGSALLMAARSAPSTNTSLICTDNAFCSVNPSNNIDDCSVAVNRCGVPWWSVSEVDNAAASASLSKPTARV
jgi:hypothetical protein